MFGQEIRNVRETARLLVTRYPDAALQIAKALAADNQERGQEKRAHIWELVATAIEASSLAPARN